MFLPANDSNSEKLFRTDVGYGFLAPTKKEKAQRLWKWASDRILEQAKLKENKDLGKLSEGMTKRLGWDKKGTKILPSYYDEVLFFNHKGLSYFETWQAKERFIADFKIHDGEILITNSEGIAYNDENLIFVLDHAGRLLIAHPFKHREKGRKKIHHSSLAAGHPVFAAGQLNIENGKIVFVSDQSGHYRPKTSPLMVRFLLSKQIDLSTITLDYIGQTDSYIVNCLDFAKNSGKTDFENYKINMQNRNKLVKEIFGVLELHLPLLFKDNLIYPIHIAAMTSCSPDVMDFLLECGCNPNSMTSDNETPLGLLCESDNPNKDLIRKLIMAGADPHQSHGKSSKSPLVIIKERGLGDIQDFISD